MKEFVYRLVYSNTVVKTKTFPSKQAARDYAYNEGDHLLELIFLYKRKL
jgi:hypothetical protein